MASTYIQCLYIKRATIRFLRKIHPKALQKLLDERIVRPYSKFYRMSLGILKSKRQRHAKNLPSPSVEVNK